MPLYIYILKCPWFPKGNVMHATSPIFYVGLSQRTLQIWWMSYLFLSNEIAGGQTTLCVEQRENTQEKFSKIMSIRGCHRDTPLCSPVGVSRYYVPNFRDETHTSSERHRWSSSPHDCEMNPTSMLLPLRNPDMGEVESNVTAQCHLWWAWVVKTQRLRKGHTARHLGKWSMFARTVSERLNPRRAKALKHPRK